MKIVQGFSFPTSHDNSKEISPLTSSRKISNENIEITVCPSTGGDFQVILNSNETIMELRKKISRKVQVPQERLKLLFKDKVLENGMVSDYKLQNGNKINLIPAMESGFSSTVQGTHQSVVQAIEGLSDSQIDDFLAGNAPLTLALRVSDHVMFVQLQLEQAHSSLSQSQKPNNSLKRGCQCISTFCHHVRSRTNKYLNDPFVTNPNFMKRNATCGDLSQRWSQDYSLHRKPDSSCLNCLYSKDLPCSPSSFVCNKQPCTCVVDKPSSVVNVNSNYRKTSTTSGKITSGIGSLSQRASSGTGSRFLRHMQRLGRLCGGHRQCVAYSSKELASEISSIVQAAKHSSSESASHKKMSGKCAIKDIEKFHSSDARPSRSSTAGASIDSVTSHGPGVFSGTFSGTLHPSIQDADGKAKRDPQTILRILNDLLNASTTYEGQNGNSSILPQLFREHFKNSLPSLSTSSSSSSTPSRDVATTSNNQIPQQQSTSRSLGGKKRSYPFQMEADSRPHKRNPVLPWMTPLQKMALFYGMTSKSPRVTNKDLLQLELFQQNYRNHAGISSYLKTLEKKQRIQVALNVSRQQKLHHENSVTSQKLSSLRQKMEMKKKNRQKRRQRSNPIRIVPGPETLRNAPSTSPRLSGSCTMRKTSVEIQMDRKTEMQHDGAETVTV